MSPYPRPFPLKGEGIFSPYPQPFPLQGEGSGQLKIYKMILWLN